MKQSDPTATCCALCVCPLCVIKFPKFPETLPKNVMSSVAALPQVWSLMLKLLPFPQIYATYIQTNIINNRIDVQSYTNKSNVAERDWIFLLDLQWFILLWYSVNSKLSPAVKPICVYVYLSACDSVIAGLNKFAAHFCHLGDPGFGDHHGDHSLPRGAHTNTQTNTRPQFD